MDQSPSPTYFPGRTAERIAGFVLGVSALLMLIALSHHSLLIIVALQALWYLAIAWRMIIAAPTAEL